MYVLLCFLFFVFCFFLFFDFTFLNFLFGNVSYFSSKGYGVGCRRLCSIFVVVVMRKTPQGFNEKIKKIKRRRS
ncbi:hypothetical protein QBC43DRAFT_5751 [Cladorrhinum sp. PSN259]|nr:hypothetical protein QBC43DRAFT_5751 [Cladorrhinum sp. PSN259]